MSLKVSNFDLAAPLDGSEIMGLVQAGGNVQATIADLALMISGGSLTVEFIQDVVGALLVAGAGITVTYSDAGDTVTIASTITQYTDEMARDAIGTAFTDSGLAVVTVDDAGNTIDVGVPAAVAADLNTGTNVAKAVTADALAGSNFGKAVITLLVTDPNGAALSTGDGKAYYRVPSALNGMNLVAVAAALITESSVGIPTIQIANVTDAVDMLSTKLTIDATEKDSSTAAAAAVINAVNDDVATADMLRIDVDVAGTGAKGLIVEMQFQLP
jgi:hypothetical protein